MQKLTIKNQITKQTAIFTVDQYISKKKDLINQISEAFGICADRAYKIIRGSIPEFTTEIETNTTLELKPIKFELLDQQAKFDYFATPDGSIYIKKHGMLFETKQSFNNSCGQKYLQTGITLVDKCVAYPVHRLVALAYCDGAAKGYDVNHIDGDRQNNHHTNLEWITVKNNRSNPETRKAVKGYDVFGNEIYSFESMKQASEALGIDHSSIWACAHGKNKSAGKYFDTVLNKNKNISWKLA